MPHGYFYFVKYNTSLLWLCSSVPPVSSAPTAGALREGPLPLAAPDISALETRYVTEVLTSGRLALGPRLEAFEQQMAARCGTRHAVAVSSGTAALHCIVRGLGLGTGDEVLTTPFSFVASANAALFEGATPRFVDIDPATYNLDPARVEAALTPHTKALLAVDVFGLPADWPALAALAERHGLLLIDDACEALGASVGDQPIGSHGAAAAFGFYPNKQITTGEGGCVTTNSEALATWCRSLRNQGRADRGRMEHVRLGFNYRLGEMAAALGCAQLERLDEILERRRTLAAWYAEALAPLEDDLALPAAPARGTRSWFVYVVRLRERFGKTTRDALMERLRAQGIGCAPYFPAIHLQPLYRERFGYAPGDFPICEAVSARTLALPFFNQMTRTDVERVAEALRAALPALARAAA